VRDALLAAGVPAERVVMIPDEQAATDAALREAEAGDLVLLFGDAITRTWKQVIQFRPEAPPRVAEKPRVSRPEPVPAPVTAQPGEEGRREFVRDVRGVWLARGEQGD